MLHSQKRIVDGKGRSIIVERHHHPSCNRFGGYWSAETFDLCIATDSKGETKQFLNARKAWDHARS